MNACRALGEWLAHSRCCINVSEEEEAGSGLWRFRSWPENEEALRLPITPETRILSFFSHFFSLMWTIFKVFIEFVTSYFCCMFWLFWLQGVWEPGSPSKDQCTPASGGHVLPGAAPGTPCTLSYSDISSEESVLSLSRTSLEPLSRVHLQDLNHSFSIIPQSHQNASLNPFLKTQGICLFNFWGGNQDVLNVAESRPS